ncbi:hypothetical protein Ssi03_50800 [Sphaerisporangium siamense]|uniref:Uncharacterized protein n=1 Tax=Sphaerisporangium siamense TaxID=795645 RepID=A0A7W7DAW1_9ACTN|nr:hypothetical protein [Sphaerisporangium siamense]MBB4702216.1 hypothetical protein [Sphaerisporangium siamense]GII87090.1 hypothetical protein Ssi03_50800 [Sphaerisporangium siamense]
MSDRPVLAVIPLPARLEVSAAILGALADVWEEHHGQTLTTAHMAEEFTPWGRALVIREPEPFTADHDHQTVAEEPPQGPAATRPAS